MSDGIITEIDGQKVKLTNLEKLLFPHAGIIKAEIIQYYKSVAPLILKYIGNRPLTLIRYPDGIEGKKFYSKNMPQWAPKWIRYAELDGDDNKYVLATRAADMVWLANLAALEIHPMQVRGPQYVFPDHFIFDLDPSPSFQFEDLKELAIQLRKFLVSKGYQPFIKTSGSKGLHIYTPVTPVYEHSLFFESIKKLAKEFVSIYPNTCTLRMSKEKRLGKVLLDIYRNHKSNSCAAPYSLRAKPFAPISMPFRWEEINDIKDSQQFKLSDFHDNWEDAWEDFWSSAVPLHDQKHTVVKQSLGEYEAKRDFKKTEEPEPEVQYGNNDQFVIQLHDATNLHYDLRLEWDGVLLSWAIPKSFPLSADSVRLAIHTEDHPVKYLDFEGEIPKNEYGGGKMWIVDRGSFQMIKKEDKKIHFSLSGKYFNGEYKLINTKEKQWLLKLLSSDISMPMLAPMLASSSEKLVVSEEFVYEVKWDGIRAIIYIEDETVKIISRSGSDLTAKFPELLVDIPVEGQHVILDGEIVVLDDKGVSDFPRVISRMHSASPKFQKDEVVFYAFDLLYLDGRLLVNEEFTLRREWLDVILKKNKYYRISELFDDGQALYDAGEKMGLEGIMVKRRKGKYIPGVRTEEWVKIKYRSEIETVVIGYTEGSGDRMPYFGALHLAIREEDDLRYVGKVGSGFNVNLLKDIRERLDKLEKSDKLIEDTIEEESKTVWVEPRIKCEVRYASWTNSGTLREPVFIKLLN